MSSTWGDSDDEGTTKKGSRQRQTKQKVQQQQQAAAATTTTTTTTAPKAVRVNPSLPSEDKMNEHMDNIKRDPDYLYRLIRVDQTKNGKDFDEAVSSYDHRVNQQVQQRVPLFLPNGHFNTAILTTPSPDWSNNSIISIAVGVGNVPAANRALKWYLDGGYEIDANAIQTLLTSRENNAATYPVLIAFIQAHSDLFSLSQAPIQQSIHVTHVNIILENAERAKAAEVAAMLIGTHKEGLKEHLDKYAKDNKYPLVNSCGYILGGVRLSHVVDPQTKAKTTHITFNYKNNQSLFRLAIDCNNAKALSDLLHHCAAYFPNASAVPALYDALKAENRLEFVPSLVDFTVRSIRSNPQKIATFKHFLKHPITGESIFGVLFDRIANVQRLHNEFQFDGAISFANAANPLPQPSTTANEADTQSNALFGTAQNKFQVQHSAVPTSPQIYRLFMELLHTSVFTIWTTCQLFSVELDQKALQLFAFKNQQKFDQMGFDADSQVESARRESSQRMMALYNTFTAAAAAIQTRVQAGTVPTIAASCHANFGKKKQTPPTPSVDFIEEFTLSTLIQFIPYLSPRWLIEALTKIPAVYVPLLNQLLPKLPSVYFRIKNSTTRFPVHQQLYEFRTKPRQIVTDANGLSPILPIAPQVLTATHLRLPSYISTLSPLNVYPQDPAKATELYKNLTWEDSAVKSMQNERLLTFQTQLNQQQREQIHPMVLLKFHPLTIIQALYLYSEAAPGPEFFSNPVTALLLQQLDTISCALEPKKYSILTRADAPACKKLADSDVVVPTQLLPMLTPTLFDFLYFCRHRKFATPEERAFYNSYYIDLLDNTTVGIEGSKDNLVKAVSQNTFQNAEDMLTKAQKWVPPAGHVTGSRFLSIQFMGELGPRVSRARDGSLLEEGVKRYIEDVVANVAGITTPIFDESTTDMKDGPDDEAESASKTTDDLGKMIDDMADSLFSLGGMTMDDDDGAEEEIDLNNIDWAALGC